MTISEETLWLACKKTCPRRTGETMDQYLTRLTHVNLSRRRLTSMAGLQRCRNLVALYLYDNSFSRISSINACLNLTQIYLQNNRLSRIEALASLRALTKLFLGGNRIHIVEGLHQLPKLRELHLERQQLSPGQTLVFDPRTKRSLADGLLVLNLGHTELTNLRDLHAFRSLKTLRLDHNRLDELQGLFPILHANRDLQSLNVEGNPFCRMRRYKEEIITQSRSLTTLNGGEISSTMRTFLQNWKAAIERQQQSGHKPKKKASRRQAFTKPTFKRVGVTPTPKFKSRLQPAKKGFFLPPIQTHSIASSKASSALTSPLISHRTSRAQSGFSGRQAPLPPSASSRASSIPKSATIHSC
eukprot:TRINITY_DN9280_c0_g1_i6.p1 TRINITY_DN9280_c0_g1~~TRINITY_DN9280_c0_g1_i6.p1  ORF type:complete len:357 (+),score=29.78 TRINITY_DN9280_c0_g1_i6:143-1213(+)